MRFPTTQWQDITDALAPGAGADAALVAICQRYWQPVYWVIRSRGYDPHAANDLTQDYFARLLQGRLLKAADPSRGRFRALMRQDCLFFLADMEDRRRARKRGGHLKVLSLDSGEVERRYQHEPHSDLDAGKLFDRAWALQVLDEAMARLAEQEQAAGRGVAFLTLKDALTSTPGAPTQTELGQRLGMTVDAVEGALRRLRKRYRAALRATVAQTSHEPTEQEVDDELSQLLDALRR